MKTTTLDIVPDRDLLDTVQTYKQHRLHGLTRAQICSLLGFTPNLPPSGDDKVKNEWAFRADNKPCAVWDYKGSHLLDQWSAFGPEDTLRQIFSEALKPGSY